MQAFTKRPFCLPDSTFERWSKDFIGVVHDCNPEGVHVLWCSTCLRAIEIGFKHSSGKISPWACRDEGCETHKKDALDFTLDFIMKQESI
jgi:hypothetical protein